MENNYIRLPNIRHYLYKSDSGMKLLLIPNNDATIISYGMYISVGSLDETNNELGVAHFLEHMMFKGSSKYPDTQCLNRLDELGTSYNAQTSFESTQYEIHGLPQFHDELLTILLDLYFNPQIPKEAVDNERMIILEEYNMRYDDKFFKMYNNLLKLITREKNKLYRRPIIGTKKSIKNISIDDLNNFRKKYHDYSKTLMTVSGRLELNSTISHIEKTITEMIDKPIKFTKYLPEITINKMENVLFFDTKKKITVNDRCVFKIVPGEQMIISINFPSWEQFNENNYYLNVLCSILTDGMTGRITKALREKNGMSYSQNASIDTYKPFGIFTISMGTATVNLYDAIKVVLDELVELYNNGIYQHELDKVKNFSLTGMMIYYQKQLSYFTQFTEKIANNKKIETLDEIVNKYNNISIDFMNDLIRQIINPRQMFFSIVGPTKIDKKILAKLIKSFENNLNKN